MTEGKAKITADVPTKIKEALQELAHKNRSSMTEELIKLIAAAEKQANKK